MTEQAELAQYTYNGVKVTASRRRASTRDDKKYMRTVMVDGEERLVHYGDPDMPMRRNNDQARENFVSRHNCSEKKDPTAPGFWACYDWENTSEMSESTPNELADGFLYFELQEAALTPGRPFSAFAAGEFVDMMGREVEFGKNELQEFLSNTLDAIKAAITKGMPGLPIDARQHDKGDAAGWITGAELGEVVDSAGTAVPVIKVLADWTKLGVELIKNKIQTNFSPTVDLKNKVIRGGSLTNWPASVDKNGTPLFEAVELAQGVNYLKVSSSENGGGLSVPNNEEAVIMASKDSVKPEAETVQAAEQLDFSALRDQLREEVRNEVIADLAQEKGANPEEAMKRLRETLNLEAFANVADLGQARDAMLSQMKQALEAEYNRMQSQAGKMLAEMMGQIKRDQHIAELAQRWTGGTDEKPHGFPVGREEIETFLANLSDKSRAAAESIFGRIWQEGLTEFSEIGHGRKVKGTAQLDPAIARQLKQHVDNGGDIAEWFEMAGPIVGDMAQYDLSAFEQKAGGK